MRRRVFLQSAIAALVAPGYARSGARTPLGSIAYIQSDGLWVRDLPSGRPVRLADGVKLESPRFSASGQWIAYKRGETVRVVSRDGRADKQLGKGDSQWVPGQDILLVGSSSGLDVFAPANLWNGALRAIPGATLPAIFSSNGAEIAYGEIIEHGIGADGVPIRTGRLSRVALAASSTANVVCSDPSAALIPCVWTGSFIVYWRDEDFSASLLADGLELFRVQAAGGTGIALGVTTLVNVDMVSLSPDRTMLALTDGGGREEWESKGIAVLDPGSGAVRTLTGNDMAAVCPSWSPDGSRIAYSAAPASTSNIGGGEEAKRLLANRRIWVIDASGKTGPLRITNDPAYRDEEPLWSPDGSHLLLCRMDANDGKTLWLVESGGRNPVTVAGPLYADPGLLGVDGTWFGYYGYIDWRKMFDWFR